MNTPTAYSGTGWIDAARQVGHVPVQPEPVDALFVRTTPPRADGVLACQETGHRCVVIVGAAVADDADQCPEPDSQAQVGASVAAAVEVVLQGGR